MWIVLFTLVEFVVFARILLRPHRDPASRIAWIVVVGVAPVVGMIAYLLLGETNIGRRQSRRLRTIEDGLPPFEPTGDALPVSEQYEHLARVARSISGYEPIGGNTARLMEDSNATVDSMVADIDAAQATVHLHFYIWLADNNGCKVVEALKRAAARGVACRAMADGLGSRAMIASEHWKAMRAAGVKLAVALPIGGPWGRLFRGRMDLRNHRKILVIDSAITYCGSQNCADPEFRVKPKFAPWVDAMIRFEGPIARQNQRLWATDWMEASSEDINDLLRGPVAGGAELPAVVFGTGPTVRFSAMPEMFESLLHAARKKVVISTPYYVPDSALQQALCAAARRGVDVTIVFPARNDSWIVGAASRSYYLQLLRAGVKIHEYVGGLLHTKSFTLDDDITLIGSANMDRRSFELNYENNTLFQDPQLTADVRERQATYLASSNPVALEDVEAWPIHRRLFNNAIAMLGPVL
ncbi:MAG: cardiolipin synthase [Planctomycetota bacterium]|jgi:cardiolipin synthase